MTPRKRYLETIHFGKPDRIPYRFGHPRESTLSAWYYQGLKKGANLEEVIGYDHWDSIPIDFLPLPRFEEITLEEYENKRIWIDELGAKRIDHRDPATPGFVTRSWLEFPVKNRNDFEKMKERYKPDTPGRFPKDWEIFVAEKKDRDYVLQLTVYGPFWRVRDWVGFENLCMMFLTDPKLVRDMMEYTIDFTIETLKDKIKELAIDFVFISEDMAYKTASMISPKMVKEFMVSGYKRLIEFLKGIVHKVTLVYNDHYGHSQVFKDSFK